jgi:hypothetical protein
MVVIQISLCPLLNWLPRRHKSHVMRGEDTWMLEIGTKKDLDIIISSCFSGIDELNI